MSTLEILATGDLGPCRDKPEEIFTLVRERLHTADLVFGQLEPVLTDRGSPAPQARLAMRASPNTARAIRDAGFDCISFASNHCLDWGNEGLLDTLAALRSNDLTVVGAGENIGAARAPVFFERFGTRIGCLAYNSILPMGYWAEERRPGCAPMRAWTVQDQIEHDQPGTPSRVHSFADRDDLEKMIADIHAAKAQADVLMLSVHWGIHFVPNVLAAYQREVAYAAIDAGVDIVIGHHPHVIKPVEVYRNKVIAYSLANFALDPPGAFQKGLQHSRSHKEIAALNPNWKGEGNKMMLADSQRTMGIRIVVSNGAVERVSVLPITIDDDSRPSFLAAADEKFLDVAKHLYEANRAEGIETSFALIGDELEVNTK